MFNAKVYKVMKGNFSDTMEEGYAAKETIRKWNVENAEKARKLYMLTDWSVNAEDHRDVDVVVGIVGNRIDKTDFIEGASMQESRKCYFSMLSKPR